MRFRRLLQIVPALLAALFLLAGANGTRPVLGPAPQMYLPVTCAPYTLVTDGQATFSFAAGGISQPLPPYDIVSACSLHVQGTGWAHLDVNLRSWDPTALAPDPTTVSLRTATLDPSDLLYYTQNRMQLTAFIPPVITRAVTGVAEAPLSTTAIEATHPADPFGYPFVGYFDPASPEAGLPAANAVAPDGSHAPLAGAHPVIAQALCAGDASLQDLRLGQCVNRTDDTLASSVFQILQRFRVPAALDLQWIELAVAPIRSPSYQNAGTVAILDAEGVGTPATTLPAAFVQANFPNAFVASPKWAADVGLDRTLQLQPNHDYFLLVDRSTEALPVELGYGVNFYTRTLTGTENPAFQYAIRELYTRTDGVSEWSTETGRALSFKLIGVPHTTLSVPHPAQGAFRLAVAPNPVRDVADVTWSGAVGPIRVEVFDARGRRVATGQGGAAGTWRWSASNAHGQPLPSGVYFVHARDTAGGHTVQRFVLYR